MSDITKKPKNKIESVKGAQKGVLVGVGIAALVAAAAGTYFLYGSKDAGKRRKKIKGWALKAKGEILEKLESVSEMSEEIYHNIVKEVVDRYEGLKHIQPKELKEFKSELKTNWGKIKKEITATISKRNNSSSKSKTSTKKKK